METEHKYISDQVQLISALVLSPDALSRLRPDIMPDMWRHRYHQYIVKCILLLFDQNGIPPRKETLIRYLDQRSPEDLDQLLAIVGQIYCESQEESSGTFTEELTFSVRRMAALTAGEKYIALIVDGKFDAAYREIEKSKGVGTGDVGYDYLNPANTKERLHPDSVAYGRKGLICTGYSTYDQILKGGIGYPELHAVVGRPGYGKSQFVQNIAINCAINGKKVLIVTLEMDEPVVSGRLDQMFLGCSIEDTLLPSNVERLITIQNTLVEKGAYIDIKRFPEYATTCGNIEAYVIRKGIDFDLIIIDYLDLMMPESEMGNYWTSTQRMFAQTRSMSGSLCSSMLTVLQPKNIEDGILLTMERVAGAYGKMYVVDSVLTLNADQEDIERGILRGHVAKNRYGHKGQFITFSTGGDTMRISEQQMVC